MRICVQSSVPGPVHQEGDSQGRPPLLSLATPPLIGSPSLEQCTGHVVVVGVSNGIGVWLMKYTLIQP